MRREFKGDYAVVSTGVVDKLDLFIVRCKWGGIEDPHKEL